MSRYGESVPYLPTRFFKALRQRFWHSSPLEIFTDGGCKKNVGTWAFVVSLDGKVIREHSGRTENRDSTAMEFEAAIRAIDHLPENSKLILYSDSRILIDAMSLGLEPPTYRTQISRLRELSQYRSVEWRWVQAHGKHRLNNRCDELCVLARTG